MSGQTDDMRTRVAVVVEQFWHPVPGGTAVATAGTLEGLKAGGTHDLVGVAGRHPQRLGPAGYQPANGEMNGLPTWLEWHQLGLPRPVLYDSWHRLRRPAVEQATGPIDVVWAPAMAIPAATAPVVATVHDLDFLAHPERLTRRGRSFFPAAWNAALEHAALLVCPSETVADDCIRHGADAEQLRVVPWGIDTVRATPAQVEHARGQLSLPPRFALFTGTFEPRKNLPRLVEALELLGDIPLVVAGPSGWLHDEQSVLAPLGDRVHRVGHVDRRTLRALLAAADILVLPSLAEGFGLPVIEAMAEGTAVITSAGTATEEVAGGAAMLIDPLNVGSLREALGVLWADDQGRADLAARGRRRAADFSWEATAAGYAAVFGEAVGAAS